MNNIEIFEPAMCCESGLCGVNIDPELMRVATAINTLKKKGASISRYNFTSSPRMFVMNKVINKYVNENGTKSLPVIMVNGEIVKIEKYPTNEEFENWCGIKIEDNNNNDSACSCSDGCC